VDSASDRTLRLHESLMTQSSSRCGSQGIGANDRRSESSHSSASGFTDRYDLNADGMLEMTPVTPGATALNPALFIDVAHYHQPSADEWNAGLRRP